MNSQYTFNNIKKLGLGIMGFEGSEHLYNVISEIRDLVDYVVLGYQTVSYHGEPISSTDNNIIHSVYDEGLIDTILTVDLDKDKHPREQETDKRNLLIENGQENGCTHMLIIDADEYYTHDAFLSALQLIDRYDYDITYCQYLNYYKDYQHYLVYPFKKGMYVPFVTKSTYRFEFNSNDLKLPSDPSRRYIRKADASGEFIDSYYVFPWKELKMHHFSWIRNNIFSKLHSWSSKTCFDNINNLIDKAAYDFMTFTEDKEKVHLIFNTPGNTVDIAKFDKAYIHPKKDIKEYDNIRDYKKLVILNMSSTANNGLFETLETACRETWAKDVLDNKLGNISYYSVIDTDDMDLVDMENNIVYIHQEPGTNNLFALTYRFFHALELLKDAGVTYDYIVKTNTSTWLNIPFINDVIAAAHDDMTVYGFRIEGAFWSTYNLYMQGNLSIFSKRTIDIIKERIDYDEVIKKEAMDDVVIGSGISHRYTSLGIKQADMLKTMPCVNWMEIPDNEYPFDNAENYAAVQVKTFIDDLDATVEERRVHDITKMYKVHDSFLSYMNSYGYTPGMYDDAIKKLNERPDGIIANLYTAMKADHMAMPSDEQRKMRFKNHRLYPGGADELWNLQVQLKLKGGYKIPDVK